MEQYENLLSHSKLVVEFLLKVRRHFPRLMAKSPTQWVAQRYPGCTIDEQGNVRDAEGNVIANVALEVQHIAELQAAFTAWRACVAILEGDSSFLQLPGVTGVDHRHSIEKFLPFDSPAM